MGIWKWLIFCCACMIAAPSFATPTDAQVLKHVKGENTITVQFDPAKPNSGLIHHNWEDGVKVTRYVRGWIVKGRTEYPGVTYNSEGATKYFLSGGNWIYERNAHYGSTFAGIPNPSIETIRALVDANPTVLLPYDTVRLVSVELADEPEWVWPKVDSVEVKLKVVREAKPTTTEFQTLEQVFHVRFYGEGFKSPMTRYLTMGQDHATVLSTQTLSESEWNKIAFLRTTLEESSVDLSHLPKVEVPVFSTPREAAFFTHSLASKGNPDEVEAFLRATLSSKHFAPGSRIVLSEKGKRAIETSRSATLTYANANCPDISNSFVDEHGTTTRWMTTHYSNKSTVKLVEEDGVNRLAEFDLNGNPRLKPNPAECEKRAQQAAEKAAAAAAPPPPPVLDAVGRRKMEIAATKELLETSRGLAISVGDGVFVQYGSGTWYAGTVSSISGGRYSGKYADGASFAVDKSKIVKRVLNPGSIVFTKSGAVTVVRDEGSRVVVDDPLKGQIAVDLRQISLPK